MWNEVKAVPVNDTAERPDPIALVRMIAVARIMMPKSVVRLSAGRQYMTDELQALCFVAGANSIFIGDVLLTTKNPQTARDAALLDRLGIRSRLDDAEGVRSASLIRSGRVKSDRPVTENGPLSAHPRKQFSGWLRGRADSPAQDKSA